jgi:hypothetical protein
MGNCTGALTSYYSNSSTNIAPRSISTFDAAVLLHLPRGHSRKGQVPRLILVSTVVNSSRRFLNYVHLWIRFYRVGGARSGRKKWIHCSESVTIVLFVADVACCNELFSETNNAMTKILMPSQAVCNLEWFSKSKSF